MIAKMIEGMTRVLGKSQGYNGLPVRDELYRYPDSDQQAPCMTTAWEPTPKEIEAIAAGAAIEVTLLGDQHPPILVTVGSPPSRERAN